MPVVNIDGVGPGGIRFSGPMLADIYLGKIKNWNDPAIRALNPGLNLPAATISVIHRLDGSGTTFNWANYLSKVSPEWKQKVGEGTAVEWPTGAGGKGNEGVARVCRVGEKLDRLRRVCLRHQKQAGVWARSEQGGTVRSTRRRDVPGRRRERQLGGSKRFLPRHDAMLQAKTLIPSPRLRSSSCTSSQRTSDGRSAHETSSGGHWKTDSRKRRRWAMFRFRLRWFDRSKLLEFRVRRLAGNLPLEPFLPHLTSCSKPKRDWPRLRGRSTRSTSDAPRGQFVHRCRRRNRCFRLM